MPVRPDWPVSHPFSLAFSLALYLRDGLAFFVRKIEIAQDVSFCKSRPDKEKKIFYFFDE